MSFSETCNFFHYYYHFKYTSFPFSLSNKILSSQQNFLSSVRCMILKAPTAAIILSNAQFFSYSKSTPKCASQLYTFYFLSVNVSYWFLSNLLRLQRTHPLSLTSIVSELRGWMESVCEEKISALSTDS